MPAISDASPLGHIEEYPHRVPQSPWARARPFDVRLWSDTIG